MAAYWEIDGVVKKVPMRAARRGSFLLWRLVEGVVDTSMPGAVWLVRACALSRWRLARDDHRSSLDGAEAWGGRAIFWN